MAILIEEKNTGEIIKNISKKNFSLFITPMEEFAFTDFKIKQIHINESLDPEPKLFMLLHEYSHILRTPNLKGKTNFSIIFEKEDEMAFEAYKKITNTNGNALKKYSFIYNKISHLY